MKLALAIADTNAHPSAFVVFRGFEASIAKAARLGYHGVELALKHPDEVDRVRLRGWLKEAGIEVSCISTGQVFAGLGLMCTDPNPQKRQQLRGLLRGLIDLAQEFGGLVNLGRVRGRIGDDPRAEAEARFIEMARDLCDYAATRDVTLILEPVNRYEIDFINSVEEGVDLMRKVGRANMKLMPDVFHMNIEDKTIGPELARWIHYVGYIHFADSNRLAPGQGHTDFDAILRDLAAARYDGWISVEILPKPDPDTAARQAAEFLRPRVDAYNQHKRTEG
jgi:sugar phosphate isomerase/epimerase